MTYCKVEFVKRSGLSRDIYNMVPPLTWKPQNSSGLQTIIRSGVLAGSAAQLAATRCPNELNN